MSNEYTGKFRIDSVIEREEERNRREREKLEQQYMEYPRGTLTMREVNGRKYCYLRYRDGKDVVTKYAGTEDKAPEIRKMIAKRDALREKIKRLDAEYEKIEKIEMVK